MEFLMNLVNETFEEAVRSYRKPNIKHSANQYLSDNLETRYMDDRILQYAKENLNDMAEFTLQVNDIKVVTKIYHNKNKKYRYIFDFLSFYIDLLLRVLYTLKPQQQIFNLYILLTPFKKEFPKTGETLTPYNVNSGVTIRYSTGLADVVVYREEEVLKVLLHELIHAMTIDLHSISYAEEMPLQKIIQIDRSITLNESFTDCLACFLNICIFSVIYSKLNEESYIDVCNRILDFERTYILCKSLDVLNYTKFKLDCAQGFLKRDATTQYVENTHVLSYYVIKAILFSDIESFLMDMRSNMYNLINGHAYAQAIVKHFETRRYCSFMGDIGYKPVYDRVKCQSLRMSNIDVYTFVDKFKSKLLKNLLSNKIGK